MAAPAMNGGLNPRHATLVERTVTLPLKLALTSTAVEYFRSKQYALGRVSTANGSEGYGFTLSSLSLARLKAMLRRAFISQVEAAHPDLMAFRSPLMELSKCLCTHVLLKRFTREVVAHTLGSEPVKQWKRAHPSAPLDSASLFGSSMDSAGAVVWEQDARMIRNSLLEPLFKQIDHARDLEREEKEERREFCNSCFEDVSPSLWTLVARIHAQWRNRSFLNSIGEMLDAYLRRTAIAEYLSLMLAEIVAYLQNLNMGQYVIRRYHQQISRASLMRNEALRERILGEMVKDAEKTCVTWSLDAEPRATCQRSTLGITLFNRDIMPGRMQDEFRERSGMSLVSQSLNDFMRDPTAEHVDIGLGLSYLSHLRDVCAEHGASFASSIHHAPKGNVALITCSLQF